MHVSEHLLITRVRKWFSKLHDDHDNILTINLSFIYNNLC